MYVEAITTNNINKGDTHMLIEPMIEKLYEMKLNGMVAAVEEQRKDSAITELGFEDRFAMLVERQYLYKEDRALKSRLRYAGLNISGPCLENINYRANRNLTRNQLEPLTSPQWISQGRNVMLTGPTGVGKSYIAKALARQACKNGFRTLLVYSPKLFRSLKTAELDGSLPKLLGKFAKVNLLVVDDFGLEKAAAADYRLFLEILQDRIEQTSTLVTSQYDIGIWHELIKDSTIADAILDRLVHSAYQIDLQGESMRNPKNNNDRHSHQATNNKGK
jgi:DNA replication protein DnaC